MIGRTISHYKILEKLGGGGMGVVYKAQDIKLDRTVALKFLPPHMLADKEAEQRFISEARAASSFDHPNICTIHDINKTEDDQFYIVMGYYTGETLKKKLDNGPLQIDSAINYAVQIANGLARAHEAGIIHRDIKPANIMITDRGEVKILDFGLAKVSGQTQLTQMGSTVGTVSYMSPEQTKGEEVDLRTDLWSFGVVLYEMISGKLPFKGDYEQAVVYSILNEQPQSAESYRSDIPTELILIINRSLEKDPNDRYQSLSELLIDLNHHNLDFTKVSSTAMSAAEHSEQYQKTSTTNVRSTKKQKHKKRLPLIASVASLIIILILIFFLTDAGSTNQERLPIAVADFINQTNEPELDGLSGMLITSLEQSRKLAVVTRSRMFDILVQIGKKDVEKIDESLGQQICKQANIKAMVVATIRKFGKLYTIDLKVVDPNKNEYLFTAKEEAEGQESIPSMLDRLSEKTRIGLKEKIAQINESNQNIASVTTSNLEAYQHFFQGEQLINRLNFREAIKEFEKAVALDSTFAQAYYRLAYAESWADSYSGGNEEISRNHLERVLKNINRLPEKEHYLVRAQYAIIDNDYKEGVAILKEMEQFYPNEKEMIYNIGDWSYHLQEFPTAITYLEKTLQIDPNNQRALQHLTMVFDDMENYNKMLETAKRYVAVSGSGEAYQYLGDAYTKLGQYDQGIKSLLQARDLFPEKYSITGSIANLYTYQKEYAKAEAELKKMIEKNQSSKVKQFGYQRLANFYPYQGKYRNALQSIDKKIELLKQENDTIGIAVAQIFRGFKFIYGWNNTKRAWKEVEKTIPVQNKTTHNYFWGSVNLMQVYRGDYTKAVRLAKTLSPKWWAQIIQSTIFSLKRDQENAEIFADSVIQTGSGFPIMFVLYPLAECQYENGNFNKALESLNKMQKIYDPVWIRGIYYPKSFYLMGKIYEKKGDTKLAIKNYEKFLELWNDADKDLPDLIDAKTRYAKLKKYASK